MLKIRLSALALTGVFVSFTLQAQFASSVVSYSPGTGLKDGFSDANRILGAPTTFIGYQNADPFNPPYATNNLTGVGTGGSLTLRFDTPIQNTSGHPFGLDFIVFGHAGFTITNGDYLGGGITDGSFYQGGTATTRVSVSADGSTFYTLNSSLAPALDGLYPPDADGNFFLPVNPNLTGADFAGKDLAGIRALYAGSAGGAGFDLSWAQDANGQTVSLSSVSYVRIDVLTDRVYLDAVAVVPEPSVGLLAAIGLGSLLATRPKKAI